jgi:signal transduction histidine kinase
MKILPLRWKLALSTASLASLVLVAVGLGVSWHLYRDGVADLDMELREVSSGFFTELERHHRQVDWDDRAVVDSLFPAVTTLYRIEIVDHGRVVYRSRNLGSEQFPPLTGRHAFATIAFPDARMRVAEITSKEVSLRLATNLHYEEETRDDLLESFLIAAPVALLLIGVGGWWIAGRALAPVNEITAAAQRITAQRLDRRLPMPGTRGDEIERLTVVLNQMIDRLEGSFLQATRFTADASHELKTPLTVIRGEIEAAIGAGDHSPAQEKMLLNLFEETTRLVTITEDLLLLSRADAGKLRLATTAIDLSVFLDEMIEDVEILADRRALKIQAEIPRGIFIQADDHFLRQLLLNLFDNAIKYNHTGGQLRVRIIAGPVSHQIAIANTGPGLTAEQAAHVFDRFYRGDAARDRSVGGHGLGLSICGEIVRALDGEISVHIDEADWTEFRVTLPTAQPVAPDEAPAPRSLAERRSSLQSAPL